MNRLEGKVAIVTGGGGALGSATTRRLVQEGARVVVADVNIEAANDACRDIEEAAWPFQYDASSAESIKELIDKTIERYGRIDILNNNVAHTQLSLKGGDSTLLDTPIEVWDASYAVNVRSYFITSKYAVPHMLKQGGGVLVNIASGSALGGDASLIAYGSSKAAVVMLSKYIAAQYGKKGIRSNVICPGPIKTPNLEKYAPETLETTLKVVYVPELGEPKHIAAAVAYLSSEDAAYCNGTVLTCDGGLTGVLPQWMATPWSAD